MSSIQDNLLVSITKDIAQLDFSSTAQPSYMRRLGHLLTWGFIAWNPQLDATILKVHQQIDTFFTRNGSLDTFQTAYVRNLLTNLKTLSAKNYSRYENIVSLLTDKVDLKENNVSIPFLELLITIPKKHWGFCSNPKIRLPSPLEEKALLKSILDFNITLESPLSEKQRNHLVELKDVLDALWDLKRCLLAKNAENFPAAFFDLLIENAAIPGLYLSLFVGNERFKDLKISSQIKLLKREDNDRISTRYYLNHLVNNTPRELFTNEEISALPWHLQAYFHIQAKDKEKIFTLFCSLDKTFIYEAHKFFEYFREYNSSDVEFILEALNSENSMCTSFLQTLLDTIITDDPKWMENAHLMNGLRKLTPDVFAKILSYKNNHLFNIFLKLPTKTWTKNQTLAFTKRIANLDSWWLTNNITHNKNLDFFCKLIAYIECPQTLKTVFDICPPLFVEKHAQTILNTLGEYPLKAILLLSQMSDCIGYFLPQPQTAAPSEDPLILPASLSKAIDRTNDYRQIQLKLSSATHPTQWNEALEMLNNLDKDDFQVLIVPILYANEKSYSKRFQLELIHILSVLKNAFTYNKMIKFFIEAKYKISIINLNKLIDLFSCNILPSEQQDLLNMLLVAFGRTSSTLPHLELHKFFNNPLFSDIVIQDPAKNEYFAHRALLAMDSVLFTKLTPEKNAVLVLTAEEMLRFKAIYRQGIINKFHFEQSAEKLLCEVTPPENIEKRSHEQEVLESLYDVDVICLEGAYKAHKVILAAHVGGYFQKLLCRPGFQPTDKTISLPEVPHAIIRTIYDNKLPEFEEDDSTKDEQDQILQNLFSFITAGQNNPPACKPYGIEVPIYSN